MALPTRSGHLHLFDRDTGTSLLETREVLAPPSTVPGERAVPVHTVSTVRLTRRDAEVAADIADLVLEPFAPPSTAGTLLSPGVRGAVGWGGAAYDPATRRLFVNVDETASVLRLIEVPLGFSAQDAYLGGPLLTASGLVFIGATPDSMFRAYGAADGTLLWEAELDAPGYATPVTYSTGGRQYVVIAAGGGLLGPPSGSSYAAFRLP